MDISTGLTILWYIQITMRPSRKPKPSPLMTPGFVRTVALARDRVDSFDEYPFDIPAIKNLGTLKIDPRVTFFVGENGSGKSTLVEGIAVAAGFNAEGGTKNFDFATRESHSSLSSALSIARGVNRETDGFFLRAESLYNVATQLDNMQEEHPAALRYYGGKSLHEQSHGESFIALISNRFREHGLFILDEPEAALSPSRQIMLLKLIDHLTRKAGSQFIIATHSPILLAYPDALIYGLDEHGIAPIKHEDTEHYRITLDFLTNRETYLRHLFNDDEEG